MSIPKDLQIVEFSTGQCVVYSYDQGVWLLKDGSIGRRGGEWIAKDAWHDNHAVAAAMLAKVSGKLIHKWGAVSGALCDPADTYCTIATQDIYVTCPACLKLMERKTDGDSKDMAGLEQQRAADTRASDVRQIEVPASPGTFTAVDSERGPGIGSKTPAELRAQVIAQCKQGKVSRTEKPMRFSAYQEKL